MAIRSKNAYLSNVSHITDEPNRIIVHRSACEICQISVLDLTSQREPLFAAGCPMLNRKETLGMCVTAL
jgi:hypothetical protein